MITDSLAQVIQRLPSRVRTVVVMVTLGLAAGLIAVLFSLAIHFVYDHGIEALAQRSRGEFLIGSFLIVALTSAFSGWLLTQFCPDAAGSGIPQLKLAFWKDFGVVPWRVVWVKFIGGALSVGGGSSLGREGPSVQLGGALASNLSGVLGEPKQNRRAAAAAGAAAGLAAAFNTPIAAVVFALEEIIGDLNSRMLGGVLVAAVLGALVTHGILGAQPAFVLHGPGAPSWLSYALTPLVSVVAALAGCWFQRFALGLRAFNRHPARLPAWTRVMLGALAAWAIGAAVFWFTGHLGVFSLGYADLSAALDGRLVWQIAALLLLAKLAATALCYGFGGCGGIFAPTLFFGAMAGAALSGAAGLLLPLTMADHVALAVVGMCACLGAVVRAPVTGILIVFEMTHEFALVPVLMIGALLSQLVSRRLNRDSFYEAVLAQDGQHLERIAPPRDLHSWMELPAGRIASFSPAVANDLTPAALRDLLAQHNYDRFPVVADGRLAGVLTRRAAEQAITNGARPPLEAAVTCRADTPLREVSRAIIASPSGLMVLTTQEGPVGRVVGVLTLHDFLRAQMNFTAEQHA